MDRNQFEASLQGRILVPKMNIQFSSLLFQTEYTPEDFIKLMNAGSNSVYFVNKEASGAGKSKYSVVTLTQGYVCTNVADNPPAPAITGGAPMGIVESATQWFENHHTVRKVVKGTIISFLGLVVASQLEIVSALETMLQRAMPDWMPLYMLVRPLIIGAFLGIANYLKNNPTLPVVGARKI